MANTPQKPADQTPAQQVRVTRTEIPTPTLDNPAKVTVQVQYQIGMLPPRFLYFDKSKWTKGIEAAAIMADLSRVIENTGETITL